MTRTLDRHPMRRRQARLVAGVGVVLAIGLTLAWVAGRDDGRRVVAAPAVATSAAAPSPPPTSTTAPPVTPPTTAPEGPAVVSTLTPDGTDSYRVTQRPGRVEAHAPETNVGGNLRVAVTGADAPSVDQEVCTRWDGPVDRLAQPGLALRVRDGSDGTAQAVTITNNVYGATRWVWNVHLWLHPHVWRVASVELPGAMMRSTDDVAPLPWHLCARAVGSAVSFVVWTGDRPPRWDDAVHGATVELPAGWDFEGRPGVYVGHLLSGVTTVFDDVAARALVHPADRHAPRPLAA